MTLDTGIGRRLQALGPVAFEIASPPKVVFDVIADPYLNRTPRGLSGELQVLGWSVVRTWSGARVARQWERAVRRSIASVSAEAVRRAA